MKESVTLEVAQTDVRRWLDAKKIGEQKRADKQDGIDSLVAAVVDGVISIKEDCTIVHKLKFPTRGENNEIGVSEVTYKSRLSTAQLQAALRGAKLGDGYGVIISVVALLTGEVKGVINCFDSEDIAIGSAIANFFL